MGDGLTVRINRAPVLTLWAAVVAERRGAPRDAALTLGQTLAGLSAYAKGVRLGLYTPSEKVPSAPPLPAGVRKVHDVVLLGRHLRVAETASGLRAIAKGEVVDPARVERYLASRFGEALEPVRSAMEQLAASRSPDELEAQGFHLYEQFRPDVPQGERGWGAKGVLDRRRILALIGRAS
jgi:hypothetical protein